MLLVVLLFTDFLLISKFEISLTIPETLSIRWTILTAETFVESTIFCGGHDIDDGTGVDKWVGFITPVE